MKTGVEERLEAAAADVWRQVAQMPTRPAAVVHRRLHRRRVAAYTASLAVAAALIGATALLLNTRSDRPVIGPPSTLSPTTATPSVDARLQEVIGGLGPVCDRSSVRGDFDGDGATDLVAIVARRPTSGCPTGTEPRAWVLAAAWSTGASGSWPLPKCGVIPPDGSVTPTGLCRAFAAPDLNADGRAELVVKIQQAAGSMSLIQIYEPTPAVAALEPVEVASGGPDRIGPGQVAVLIFGSAPGYEENLRCETTPEGNPVLVSTDAESQGEGWSVFEMTWRLNGRLAQVSKRTYSVSRDAPETADLVAGHDICGAPISADGSSTESEAQATDPARPAHSLDSSAGNHLDPNSAASLIHLDGGDISQGEVNPPGPTWEELLADPTPIDPITLSPQAAAVLASTPNYLTPIARLDAENLLFRTPDGNAVQIMWQRFQGTTPTLPESYTYSGKTLSDGAPYSIKTQPATIQVLVPRPGLMINVIAHAIPGGIDATLDLTPQQVVTVADTALTALTNS